MSTIAKIDRDLGRVEGKLDTFIRQMETQDNRTTDLEVRTRKVESRQHWYSGAGAVVGVLLGALGFHGAHG
jgi:hypothetical protein